MSVTNFPVTFIAARNLGLSSVKHGVTNISPKLPMVNISGFVKMSHKAPMTLNVVVF